MIAGWYYKPVYPEQKEICLKCGIFPHYIIGFVAKSELFVINPTIIDDIKKSRSMDDIIIHGLNVNQDRFQEMLPQTTNYRKSVVFVDGEYFYL